MNLYAICPVHAPNNEVSFILAETDAEAIEEGVFVAAIDVAKVNYCSPSADVYLVARDVQHIGKAWATDAPRDWDWAHPAVEENAAEEACRDAVHAPGALGDLT